MWSLLSHIIVGLAVAVATHLITKWLDRRGEKIPKAQRGILEVLKEHRGKGTYLTKSELQGRTHLPDKQLESALLELKQRGEIKEVVGWGAEDQYIITERGLWILAKGRRPPCELST